MLAHSRNGAPKRGTNKNREENKSFQPFTQFCPVVLSYSYIILASSHTQPESKLEKMSNNWQEGLRDGDRDWLLQGYPVQGLRDGDGDWLPQGYPVQPPA